MQIAELPYLEEFATVIEADVDDVWPALIDTIERTVSRAWAAGYARVVGCTDRTASGPRPLAEDSIMPGFRVDTAVPGTELALAGHHRFSSYALIFRLEQLASDRARLSVETRADLPGFAGGVYRLLAVRTGAHAVAVRRLLSAVKHGAEPRTRSRS